VIDAQRAESLGQLALIAGQQRGMGEAIAGFDFSRFGRAPARFDEAELAQLNARILHQTPFEAEIGAVVLGRLGRIHGPFDHLPPVGGLRDGVEIGAIRSNRSPTWRR
jgi:hypothetical protein